MQAQLSEEQALEEINAEVLFWQIMFSYVLPKHKLNALIDQVNDIDHLKQTLIELGQWEKLEHDVLHEMGKAA